MSRQMESAFLFPSTKAALASAANLSLRLDLPRPSLERVGDDEGSLAPRGSGGQGLGAEAPIAVRACLRVAGIDPDGEDALLLYAWATEADDAQHRDDVVAETGPPREAEEARRRSAARAARLKALRRAVRDVLRAEGLIHAPRLRPVGYRVHEDAQGRRTRVVVVDPHPGDGTVYRGPQAGAEADAVVARLREGPVVAVSVQGLAVCPHPHLRAQYLEGWAAMRWEVLGELDVALARELGVSRRHAARVRAAWGIEGSRGRMPTRSAGR